MNESLSNLEKGTRLGNYVIIRQLGTGGIGAVYLAQHRLLKQMAAIKVHDFFSVDKYVGMAFLRSANYLSQLDHPNIIRLYDYGFQGHGAYQAMEYIEGPTLASLIPNQQTTAWLDQCLEHFAGLLSALRYVHNCWYLDVDGQRKQGIVHGDIKPHNIFVDRASNTAKLADFMIPDVQSFLGQDDPDFRNLDYSTQDFGTPTYMAPEQAQGRVTQQTDIFSLGATMYELVTGHSPSTYSLIEERRWRALTRGLESVSFEDELVPPDSLPNYAPRQVNPNVPVWFDELICKAMERNPAKRFQTVAEMEGSFLGNRGAQGTSLVIRVKELIMGDKIDITTGDISHMSGQLFIGKFNEVVANLNAAGQTELAEALKILKEAVMASQHLPDDKKQEQIEIVNQIGEEATKPKPNKTLLKMLSEGLMATLKAIPDVTRAVVAAAPLLTTLYG
jgi:serine/threonine protein kinase